MENQEKETKFWKIGEIIVLEDETKPADANGSLAFNFSEKLKEELSEEKNADLKQRMVYIVTALHEVLIELQERKEDIE